MGKDTYISEQAALIGDVKIGDGTAMEDGAVVRSPPDITCKISKADAIGHRAILHSSTIRDLAAIGMGAIISIEAQVGAETTVAKGSVVRMKQIVPPSVIVGGNPAKVIRPVTNDDKEFGEYGKTAYISLAHEYLHKGLKKVDSRH